MSNGRKLSILLFLLVTGAVLLLFAACAHSHSFSKWEITKESSCNSEGYQSRICDSCGFSEYSAIPKSGNHEIVVDSAVPAQCTVDGKTEGSHCGVCQEVFVKQESVKALGHHIVVDSAVAPTCTVDGKTEGSHCDVCQELLVPQESVNAIGHSIVVDTAISATCTMDGKTEGTHCSICQTVIVPQDVITALGHKCDDVSIIKDATCIETGTKRYYCTAWGCGYSYDETYTMPTLTATEIYNKAVEYVGEIITYDKSGAELSLATGFIISSNGRVVTNYHVIEGAYSAIITVNGTKYSIVRVLAYDSKIDLAVLQISASNLPYANICKKAVEVGSTVYAIGSSRGMTNTYSQGIITYADRVVDGVSHVQHDASITHGNSGGPLINVYGEVIGINTWAISDSQNLNFAVFVDELDNLNYSSPITLSALYDRENDVYSRLVKFTTENGTYSEGYYTVTLGRETYTTTIQERTIAYSSKDGTIQIGLWIWDKSYQEVTYVSFLFDRSDLGQEYFWYLSDTETGDKIYGYFNPKTFNENATLSYSGTNITSSSQKTNAREFAVKVLDILCSRLDSDFASIGITAEDLGFYYY